MQKQQNYEIIKLDWDTDFFGVKAAKINLNVAINERETEKIISIVRSEQYEFITIINKKNNDSNNFMVKRFEGAFLADVNIQFVKKVKKNNFVTNNNNIEIKSNLKYYQRLVDITEKSFIYSRFYNDKNLKNGNKVYIEWIKNAFNRKDKYFCIYKKEKDILGYILFSMKDNKLVIELIAVDKSIQSKRDRNKNAK